MPYKDIKDLPDRVQDNLPKHKVARAAVKNKYEKGDDDKWHPVKE